MWEALWHQLHNASMKHGRTQALQKFTASQPSPDETVTQHFKKSIVFHNELIGTTNYITDHAMMTHIFTTLSDSYETTIQMLEQWIPDPTPQLCIDAICEYAERTTLTKEIGDGSPGGALFSPGGNPGRGSGHGR